MLKKKITRNNLNSEELTEFESTLDPDWVINYDDIVFKKKAWKRMLFCRI